MIYLDYNATAPLRPTVAAAMDAVRGLPLNPSSVHAGGRQAKKLLEDARAAIANALGAFPNEIIFTASGSEANNLALRGFPGRPILTSAVEHASIRKTAGLLGAAELPVDAQGLLKLDVLEQKLRALQTAPAASRDHDFSDRARPPANSSPQAGWGGAPQGSASSDTPPPRPSPARGEGVMGPLVSVMLANNETGVIQPIADITRIVHAHGGLLHCDAVQALGKIPVDWGLLGADMLTVSGHKAGGPLGAAALLIRNDLAIRPLITGGGQELGRRAGTENIAAIAGFAQLVKEVAACPESAGWAMLRDRLQQELLEFSPDAVVAGEKAERLSNTLQIAMPGVKSETQLMHFDLAGFAVSAGSACSSGRIEPSSVLLAMGVPKDTAGSAIRISIGWATTGAEIDAFAAAWKNARGKLGKQRAA